jgi:hypothetical protein
MIINDPTIIVNNLTYCKVTPKGKIIARSSGYNGGYCDPMWGKLE